MSTKAKKKKLDSLTTARYKDHKEGKTRKGGVNSPPKTKRPPPPKSEPIPKLDHNSNINFPQESPEHDYIDFRKDPNKGIAYDDLLGEIPNDLVKLDPSEAIEKATEYPLLSEVGKVLPIGFVDQNDDKHRDFVLTEWNWDMEEKLGKLMEDNPEMPINQYVSEVIGHGISSLGKIEVSKMKRSQKRLLVRNLYFSDALYIYIHIRINSLGHYLKTDKFKCLYCKKDILNFAADLRTLEVKSYDDIPSREVVLEKGIMYANKLLTKVTVGPIRWAFMETDDRNILLNSAKFKMATLKQGITKIEGAPEGPIYLTKEHLNTMSMRDINKLVDEIDQCAGGAVMEITSKCPYCNEAFDQAINWGYDDFFAPSSH